MIAQIPTNLNIKHLIVAMRECKNKFTSGDLSKEDFVKSCDDYDQALIRFNLYNCRVI